MNIEKTKSRIEWIDIFKGIGIILVVLGHINSNESTFKWIYSFHMPLFFLASGFLYKQLENKKYIKNKFYSIMIPYLIIGTLELIYWYLIERKFRENNITFGQGILGLLTGNYNYLEFNVHLWFLPCIFLLMIIYNALINLNKKASYIVISILGILGMFINRDIHLPFSVESIPKYLIFFLIGNLLNENKKIYNRIYNWKNKFKIALGIILLAISFVLSYFNINEHIFYYITAIVGIMAIMLFAMLIEKKDKIIKEIGKITIIVLCTHGPIYRIVIKIISAVLRMPIDILRNNIILSLVVVCITIYVCYLINIFILRFCPFVIGKMKTKGIEQNKNRTI